MPCSGSLLVSFATLTLDLQNAILAGDNLAEIESHLYYSLQAEVATCDDMYIEGLGRQLIDLILSRQEAQMKANLNADPERNLCPSY